MWCEVSVNRVDEAVNAPANDRNIVLASRCIRRIGSVEHISCQIIVSAVERKLKQLVYSLSLKWGLAVAKSR